MFPCFPPLVHGYGHNPLILPYIFQANTSTDNAQDQQWLSHPQGELVNALDNQKMTEGSVRWLSIPSLQFYKVFMLEAQMLLVKEKMQM